MGNFATSFWHADCVRGMSQTAFTERYRKWYKRNGYNIRVKKYLAKLGKTSESVPDEHI